ncbi:MAG: His/Gly/Thr/Pro-type tRNA ligase C-terminal domain-containing protein, partial [Candidatus Omnitrophica bacterium]|nr:His/Gly/Thr/Pro-type tRNA ligase C-terminal domain-containing protein [Candidatus Omnitrophota bacterium]
MLHRVILGSIERFFGALIEHHGGNFPIWLAPVQTKIIPIADKHHEFCKELQKTFLASDIRSEVDLRSEKMQKKIREAEKEKIPYMIVVGDKEVETQSLSIRSKIKGDMGTMSIPAFVDIIKNEQISQFKKH